MSFHVIKNALCDVIKQVIGGKAASENGRHMLTGAAILAIGASGYWGYTWYADRQMREAQRAFSIALEAFTHAKETGTADAWQQVEQSAAAAYQKHEGSRLAAPLQVLRSHALYETGDEQAARNEAQTAANTIEKRSPIAGLVSLRAVLMAMDDNDAQVREGALKELIQLAGDKKGNMHRDAALYFLGRHYWVHDMREEARDVWYNLVEDYSREQVASPWAREAISILEHMI